jgi:hypothetical protein
MAGFQSAWNVYHWQMYGGRGNHQSISLRTGNQHHQLSHPFPSWCQHLNRGNSSFYNMQNTHRAEFCVDLQPHLRAVSDGSVRNETQGTFGWSIRNENGTSIVSGMGPARGGGKVSSYRAEAYGMLSSVSSLGWRNSRRCESPGQESWRPTA